MVQAEQPYGGSIAFVHGGAIARALQQRREPRTYVAPLERKARERHRRAADRRHERPRPIEYVKIRVARQTQVRQARPLVVARHHEHRHAPVREPQHGRVRLIRQARRNIGPIEHVAAVYHDVDVLTQRGRERRLVVREEIVTPASALDARSRRQVEPEMRVRKEQDADVRCHELMYAVRSLFGMIGPRVHSPRWTRWAASGRTPIDTLDAPITSSSR